jgi:hypothetical protein
MGAAGWAGPVEPRCVELDSGRKFHLALLCMCLAFASAALGLGLSPFESR